MFSFFNSSCNMKVCRNEIPEKPIIIKAANTYPVIFGNNKEIETGNAFMQIHKKVAGRYLKVNITAFFTVCFKVVLYCSGRENA